MLKRAAIDMVKELFLRLWLQYGCSTESRPVSSRLLENLFQRYCMILFQLYPLTKKLVTYTGLNAGDVLA